MVSQKQWTEIKLGEFVEYLICDEKSVHTVSKYQRDVKRFIEFLASGELDKSVVLQWKASLAETHAPTSVNSMLVAVNSFLEWLGQGSCKVKLLKLQLDVFSKPEKELTETEYHRLLVTASKKHSEKLCLIIQTICGTGIRISELKYITVAGLKSRRVTAYAKGKNRTVFLPHSLCVKLLAFCRLEKIESGMVFRTKGGRAMNRSNIWKMMKGLCKKARVQPAKVFPHNLRHLFARTYYKLEKDITKLADLLGHSSIDTTRIYTKETGIKHIKQLDKMRLVC